MSTDQLELADGTLRQRRNLMFLTVVIVFAKHGQIEFGNETNILGTSAVIGHPDFIFPFLFILQLYFLWRFYQYFHVDGAYAHLRGQFNGTLRKNLDNEVLRQIFKALPEGITSLSGSYSYSKLGNKDSGFYEFEVESPGESGIGSSSYTVKIPSAPIEFRRIPALLGFIFRGRILTDFFLPYILVVYSVVIYVV